MPEPRHAPHKVRAEAPPATREAAHKVRAQAPPVVSGTSTGARIRVLPAGSEIELLVDEEVAPPDTVTRRRRDRRFKTHPSYRGTVRGRPVFGDDPARMAQRRRYQRDHTGAIILSSRNKVRRRGARRGSLEVRRLDPSNRFKHREAEGGRPPRISIMRPEPQPRPTVRPRMAPSRSNHARSEAPRIDHRDISRHRSAVRHQASPVHRPSRARASRTTRPSSSRQHHVVRGSRPTARPARQSSSPSSRRVTSRRSSSRATASASRSRSRSSGRSSGRTTSNRKRRSR